MCLWVLIETDKNIIGPQLGYHINSVFKKYHPYRTNISWNGPNALSMQTMTSKPACIHLHSMPGAHAVGAEGDRDPS